MHAADVADRDGACPLLEAAAARCAKLRRLWADIMSIAQKEGSGHCWPQKDLEAKDREKVQQILKQVEQARLRLFVPAYRLPIEDSRQPLLGISSARPDLIAPYVAELLTVVAGQRGISSDTEELLKETKGEDSTAVVSEGWELIKKQSNRSTTSTAHLRAR